MLDASASSQGHLFLLLIKTHFLTCRQAALPASVPLQGNPSSLALLLAVPEADKQPWKFFLLAACLVTYARPHPVTSNFNPAGTRNHDADAERQIRDWPEALPVHVRLPPRDLEPPLVRATSIITPHYDTISGCALLSASRVQYSNRPLDTHSILHLISEMPGRCRAWKILSQLNWLQECGNNFDRPHELHV